MTEKARRAIRLFWACAIEQESHKNDNHQFLRHEATMWKCIDVVRAEQGEGVPNVHAS
jgi:hypothetical protein